LQVQGQTKEAPSVLTGAFSEEQAVRGQALYYTHCLECHGEMMSGRDQAPPLAGPQFSGNWIGTPLSALVARLATMPPEKPGSLSREENVDVLAYMLWFNGFPMGKHTLTNDMAVLNEISFETPPVQ
jgi:mono/diheme cytochrome c family protein